MFKNIDSKLIPTLIFTYPVLYNYPVFYGGLEFCNGWSNKDVLPKLMEGIKPAPEATIYNFDDDQAKLSRLKDWCNENGFGKQFHGFVNTHKKLVPGTWNEERALEQLESLIKEEKWISDEEADERVFAKKPLFERLKVYFMRFKQRIIG